MPAQLVTNSLIYDVAIIGGGPGGYVAAIRAAQLGAKVVLFEEERLGGTCLNKGCIPTKALLQSVGAWQKLKRLPQLAITGVDLKEAKIDWSKLQVRKNRTVTRLTMGVDGLLQAHGVDVVQGMAIMTERPDMIRVDEQTYQACKVIIATGSKPKMPPLPGLNSSAVISSDEALSLEEVPSSLIILGGGAIGVEFALVFRALGAEVAVVELADRILPNMDEEVALEAARFLKSSGIHIYTGTKAVEIKEDTLYIKKVVADEKIENETIKDDPEAEKIRELKGEKILVAVGRTPSYKGIDVEKLGIKTVKGAIITDEFMRTSNPQIYAVGDVTGKQMLAHKAYAEGLVAVENIMGNSRKMDYEAIPQCVYSFPEIASVGITEKEAQNRHRTIKVGKFPLAANGKAQIEGETRGFVKVIVDEESGKILGVHMIGTSATELIAEAVTAMKLDATIEQLVNCIHPHPTISESVLEAYHDADHGALHFWGKKLI